MIKRFFAHTVALVALAGISSGASAQANSKPEDGLGVGIECEVLLGMIGKNVVKKVSPTMTRYSAENGSALWPWASGVDLFCENGKSVILSVTAPKGEQNAVVIYSTFAKRYRTVAGGPISRINGGYAQLEMTKDVSMRIVVPVETAEFTTVISTHAAWDKFRRAAEADDSAKGN